MRSARITDRSWFARHPVIVAYDLIGCILRVERDGVAVSGRIVETEAYAGPADPASHASRRQVAREVMGGPPGHVYTYISYGIHNMMNLVAHEPGEAGGVLLRAFEPVEGVDVMADRRGGVAFSQIGKGPGSLGQAMQIRPDDMGTDAIASDVFSVHLGEIAQPVHAGPRIGISRATGAPWRFFEHPSPYVSAHRRGMPVERHEVAELLPPPGMEVEALAYPWRTTLELSTPD
jgi:DNA-3-methyladenine glycosylase